MKERFTALVKWWGTLGLSLVLIFSSASIVTAQSKEKLKPEELVARHLDAIGTADARAALKTMIAIGIVDATFRGKGTSRVAGTSLVASDGEKNLISLIFNNKEYPYERIGFNGDKVTGAEIHPGSRSPLINFLLAYDTIIRHGLLGGTLSTAWPLLHLTDKNAKLELGGLKKIGGKQAYELKYLPRKGGDIKISLFFDAETFHHVRTEYRKSVTGQMGRTPETSAQAATETRYRLVEEFADFRKEGDLTLPHDYKLSLEIEAPSDSRSFEWMMKFTKFTFGSTIAQDEFSLG
jgi:hypothetical protein